MPRLTRKEFLGTTAALALAGSIRTAAAQDERKALPATIRVGIIGLAGHYSDITSAAKLLPNLRFTAISDPSTEALARAARGATLSAARQFTDHRALLASEQLDL